MYTLRWNGYWGREYNNVMAPCQTGYLILLQQYGYGRICGMGQLIRIVFLSRVTTYYGPILLYQLWFYGKCSI